MVSVIQRNLNDRFNTNLAVDGYVGSKTLAAISNIVAIPNFWSTERKLVGAIQYFCLMKNIEVGALDGYWGPNTENGWEQLSHLESTGKLPDPWRDDEGIGGLVQSSTTVPLQVQSELVKFYGEVGTNQTKVRTPYPLKLAWDTSTIINRFTCHEKVADSIARVLDRVLDHYGIEEVQELGLDLWGGCLNVRAMRGGTKYSTHSWGIAIDWDPARNKLRWGRDRAVFARPEYEKWWTLWEEEGWTSLLRAKNYDAMHVQRARVK